MATDYFKSKAGTPGKAFSRKLDDAMDPGNEERQTLGRLRYRQEFPFGLRYPSTVGDSIGGGLLDYNTNQSSQFATTRATEGISKDSIEPYVFFEFMSIVPRDKLRAIKAERKAAKNAHAPGAFLKEIKADQARMSALAQIEYSLIGGASAQAGNVREDAPAPGSQIAEAAAEGKESGMFKRALREYKGSIAMYMPTDVQFNDTIQYNENSRRVFGTLEGIGDSSNWLKDVFDMDNISNTSAVSGGTILAGTLTGKLANFLGKFKRLGALSNASGAAGGLIGAAGVGVATDEYQRSTGRATNPHEYMSYQNTGLRSFTYTFTFLPDSKKESEHVTQIIKEFRSAAHADKVDALTVTVPDHVIVSHHGAGDMIQLPPLVIESVNVTYNPNNSSFFLDGGNPVEVGMSVTFREIVPLFKKDIEGGM